MFYVKDKEDNIVFKSSFFRTAHQFAQEEAEIRKEVLLLWENNKILNYFYPEDEDPYYI